MKWIIWFSRSELCFEMYICFISFRFLGENKTLIAIVSLLISNLFQFFDFVRKSISFQLYWFMKGVILVILSKCFPIFSWFSATVAAYLKHRLSSLPLGEKCPYSELFWSDSPAFRRNMERHFWDLLWFFLSFIHLEDFMYGPPRLRFILWYLLKNS